MCCEDFSFVLNLPVHSKTILTSYFFQSIFDISFSWIMFIFFSSILIVFSEWLIFDFNFPCTVSLINKKLLVSALLLLLIATTSKSFLLCSMMDLSIILPILPNPLIPTFKVIIIYLTFSLLILQYCHWLN